MVMPDEILTPLKQMLAIIDLTFDRLKVVLPRDMLLHVLQGGKSGAASRAFEVLCPTVFRLKMFLNGFLLIELLRTADKRTLNRWLAVLFHVESHAATYTQLPTNLTRHLYTVNLTMVSQQLGLRWKDTVDALVIQAGKAAFLVDLALVISQTFICLEGLAAVANEFLRYVSVLHYDVIALILLQSELRVAELAHELLPELLLDVSLHVDRHVSHRLRFMRA